MYNLALWKYYTGTVFNKFKSCYNRCVKKFFGFQRRDSMSQVLIELSLPSADTVIYNSVLFHKQYTTCKNNIVAWFVSIHVWILCVIRCISLIGLVILFLLFLFVFVTMDYVWNKLDGWMDGRSTVPGVVFSSSLFQTLITMIINSSPVAEMGDRFTITDMGRKVGAAVPLSFLGRAVSLFNVTSSSPADELGL